ncbi:MAG: chemotaxis protein CheB [Longimicrobiaceae bacterium]
MPARDLVVVGASAGGVEALREIVRDLPVEFPAAVLAVVHFPSDGTSMLPLILARRGPLPAVHAEDGAEIRPGTIYVAPPDRHLMVEEGRLRLSRGPRENGHRPAVDPLFRSAALAYGPRVVAVVLSGNLDDGTAGLAAVRRHGGATVVQDPADALYPGMPRSAVEAGVAQHVVPLADLPALLVTLANTEPEEAPPVDDSLDRYENAVTGMRQPPPRGEPPGEPAGLVCPECKGSLFEIRDGELVRYRCWVGHSYGGETLLEHQTRQVEEALWTALQVLNERASLSRRTAERLEQRGNSTVAGRFRDAASESDRLAAVVSGVLRIGANGGSGDD